MRLHLSTRCPLYRSLTDRPTDGHTPSHSHRDWLPRSPHSAADIINSRYVINLDSSVRMRTRAQGHRFRDVINFRSAEYIQTYPHIHAEAQRSMLYSLHYNDRHITKNFFALANRLLPTILEHV